MNFDDNRSIYLQICDNICEQVLSGELKAQDRIPSVREYGASVGVNPNTVARSYEKLTADGVIYNKRGIGFFIADDAPAKVLDREKADFLSREWPAIRRRIALLGVDPKELF